MATTILVAVGNRTASNVTVNTVAGTGPYTLTLSAAIPGEVVVGEAITDSAANKYLITAINTGANQLTVSLRPFDEGVAPATGAATINRAYDAIHTVSTSMPTSLITADEQWILELYNDAEFTRNSLAIANFDAVTAADATRNLIIRAAAGQSFTDHVDKATNPLRYDASKGVAIRAFNAFAQGIRWNINGDITIEGLQIYIDNNTANPGNIFVGAGKWTIKNCILQTSSSVVFGFLNAAPVDAQFINCALIVMSDARLECFGSAVGRPHVFRNCSIVYPGSVRTSHVFDATFPPQYVQLVNTAVFGATSIYNATNITLNAASNYNSTDLSAPTNWGANSLNTQTYANQFENINTGATTFDFRVKAGAGLINAGTRDQTNTNDLDIKKSARSITTPTIGAWEYAVGGPPPQLAAPTSDVTSGWTPSTGATLFGVLDESVRDDLDYAYTTAPATMEVGFAALTDPAVSTGHIQRYAIFVASGQTLTVSLRQGATLIAQWVHTGPVGTSASPVLFEQTLSGTEADAITNYADLRLRAVLS